MRILLFILVLPQLCCMQAQEKLISETSFRGAFPLVGKDDVAGILFDSHDDSLIHIASGLLQQDVEMVSGKKPPLINQVTTGNMVLIGNISSSSFIQQLVQNKKLNVDRIKNQWEAYSIQLVKDPFPGVEQALVIAGSDRRGTAYGVMELSKMIGVSPWYWWADVPVKKKKQIHIHPGENLSSAPKVKYRGIFINDEAPALSGWSREKFGGFNHKFYEKVFELMLRHKANYLWPAMWGNAFYDDDPRNGPLADQWGIVIGTSHHEPLMRAHDEWRRYGKGKWNYDSNAVALRDFWRGGLQRATNEKIVTIGMRGDGDEPMTRETATELLERIVKDQRKIIEEISGRPADATPQLWALYKEVQDYYDKGMRVPDDVTLLLCDDNWGNIRRLPPPGSPKRSGGYGIYYHFDYVGGPRNYKWLNTNNISRVWEQMHLAWKHDVKRIWIVNVGDIKPMELPISFFLDYAWDPDRWTEENMDHYFEEWAAMQFGREHAAAIAGLLKKYSQYSARKKPELLDQQTYSIQHFHEADGVEKEWQELLGDVNALGEKLDPSYNHAWYQLVLHPVKAMTNLHQMYHAVARNHFYAVNNDRSANEFADKAKNHYVQDSLITIEYHSLGNGKWNHMMSQTHIGYTYWQQPPVNKMPEVKYIKGGEVLPVAGTTETTAYNLVPDNSSRNLFYEFERFVSMEASHFTKAIHTENIRWKTIPGIGKTGDGVTSFPVTAALRFSKNNPQLQYEFYNYSKGKATVNLYFSPTLNIYNLPEGLQFAVSIDDQEPVILSLNKEDQSVGIWNNWVANNIIIKKAGFDISTSGKHVLRYWMISPGVVLQKLVVDLGGLKPSYLGPPETRK